MLHELRIFTLCAAVALLLPVHAAGSSYSWRLDPETGLAVAQLTEWDTTSSATTQDNYALYYHQDNQFAKGRYLVYQHTECHCQEVPCEDEGEPLLCTVCGTSPASLVYYRLDLETGVKVPLFPIGKALAGFARGDYFYAATRSSNTEPFSTLSRVHLDTLMPETLLVGGKEIVGILAVNIDGSVILYQSRNGLYAYASWHLGELEVIAPDPSRTLEHVQFSNTDPALFTFIDQQASGLTRLGVGLVSPGAVVSNPLSSARAALLQYGDYPHPFWDADGEFWSDALNAPGASDRFVRLMFDAMTGQVTSWVGIDTVDEDWQHHQVGGRALGWFAGDGPTTERLGFGEPYIQLFHLEPPATPNTAGGQLERFRLSDALGSELEGGGNRGGNAHLLRTLDGVAFTAPYDLSLGLATADETCPASRHVFLAKLPPILKARLAADIIDTSAEGPWKHAHRINVTSAGPWHIDYGSPQSLGDGQTDATAGSLVAGADRWVLADLNGDDVDDRIAITSTGWGWRVEAAYSNYDGTLGQSVDVAETYNEDETIPPIFGDLDGDGRDDLVVLRGDGNQLVWQGRFSHGTGLPAEPYPSYGQGFEIASVFGDPTLDEFHFAEDVNGDGQADRVVVRRNLGGWRFAADFSTETGFGDSVVDTSFTGGINSTDIPLVGDVNADGQADLLLARRQGTALRWYVRLSEAGQFGTPWEPTWGGFYGADDSQPLLGHLARFTTVDPGNTSQ